MDDYLNANNFGSKEDLREWNARRSDANLFCSSLILGIRLAQIFAFFESDTSSACSSTGQSDVAPIGEPSLAQLQSLASLQAMVMASTGSYWGFVPPTQLSPTNEQLSPTEGGGAWTEGVQIYRKQRTVYRHFQVARLEEAFRHQQYMVGGDRLLLAHELGLTETQVRIWYQNRRSKWRKEQRKHKKQAQSFPLYASSAN